MLKRDITYEDFNGNTVTETFYFNLTSTELVNLEASYEGGLEKAIERIIETQNIREIIAEFQKIIILAYGVRTDDGKRFQKSDKIREEFEQSAAYDALFMELAGNADLAAQFISGIIPKQLQAQTAEALKTADIATVPPAPPAPPTAD